MFTNVNVHEVPLPNFAQNCSLPVTRNSYHGEGNRSTQWRAAYTLGCVSEVADSGGGKKKSQRRETEADTDIQLTFQFSAFILVSGTVAEQRNLD